MSTLIPCIIAGGAGTRLWPVSREDQPKPFIRLPDGQSLLQKTFLRAASLPGVARVLTVTQREQLFATLDDYRPLNLNALNLDFILEPCGRNTAPALAAAALQVAQQYGGDAQLLILPADHLIENGAAFARAVEQARTLAEQGWLVTFGITPNRADTGFGYLEQGEALSEGAFRVQRFIEKPDQINAEKLLADGRYLWNSGMFCFRADTLLRELRSHAPQILESVTACLAQSNSLVGEQGQQCELNAQLFAAVADISIDYALMQHSNKVALVPCALGWSDIGSWQAMRELLPSDNAGNQLTGEVVLRDVSNCYIDAPNRLVGAIGVADLIVIDTPDALLITAANRTQEVKYIVQELKRRGHSAHQSHHTVTRPWGTYCVIEEGLHYKIKRLVVRPGAALSLQLHQHRSEHWIVVSGTAKVRNDDCHFVLNANQSTFIPAGHKHRLSNPDAIELVMIEVQSGTYLGEDDIIRFDAI